MKQKPQKFSLHLDNIQSTMNLFSCLTSVVYMVIKLMCIYHFSINYDDAIQYPVQENKKSLTVCLFYDVYNIY